MTAQINDLFRWKGTEYDLAGISEGDLFDVSTLGLTPKGACTACWRGYQAIFTVTQSHLMLDALCVNLNRQRDEAGHPLPLGAPIINGVAPSYSNHLFPFFDTHYEGLNYPLNYSGGLLLAEGFIWSLYVHMGFHPAWKYETVIELIFDEGILKDEYNRSYQMAEIRKRITDSPPADTPNRKPTDGEVKRFIERAFDRSYSMHDL